MTQKEQAVHTVLVPCLCEMISCIVAHLNVLVSVSSCFFCSLWSNSQPGSTFIDSFEQRLQINKIKLFFHRGYLRGWACGKSTCPIGAGRTRPHSPTALFSGCQGSPVIQAFVPFWRERSRPDLKPIPAPPPLTA